MIVKNCKSHCNVAEIHLSVFHKLNPVEKQQEFVICRNKLWVKSHTLLSLQICIKLQVSEAFSDYSVLLLFKYLQCCYQGVAMHLQKCSELFLVLCHVF